MFATDDYSVFEALARDGLGVSGREGRDAKAAALAMTEFAVIAVVLHDPETHVEFHNALEGAFEELDHSTGSDLLVITICRTRPGWDIYARRRPHHRSIEEAVARVRPGIPLGSVGVQSLAARLKIPTSDLPVIVVTQEARDPVFTWVSTGAETLGSAPCFVTQLNRLGVIAAEAARGSRTRDIADIRHELDMCGGFGQSLLPDSLADTLATGLAANAKGLPPSLGEQRSRRLELASASAWGELRRLRVEFAEQLSPELEQRLSDVGVMLAHALSNDMDRRQPRHRPGWMVGFEPLTVDLLHTADYLWQALTLPRPPFGATHSNHAVNEFEGNVVADLSPMVVCLGKALEVELHLSLVQWARKLEGVEMPLWFARAIPDGRPVVDCGDGLRIDLSHRGRNPDARVVNLPIGLGLANALFKQATRTGQQAPVAHLQASPRTFMQWVDEVRRWRNKAAHLDAVNTEAGGAARALVTEGDGPAWWATLVDLKRALRGEGGGFP